MIDLILSGRAVVRVWMLASEFSPYVENGGAGEKVAWNFASSRVEGEVAEKKADKVKARDFFPFSFPVSISNDYLSIQRHPSSSKFFNCVASRFEARDVHCSSQSPQRGRKSQR